VELNVGITKCPFFTPVIFIPSHVISLVAVL